MSFRNQILEDINEYQENFATLPNIEKNEWAFNFWILDKLFAVDENIITDQIIEYKDLGIDCYVFYEETKELYLIQNKYYSDSSKISKEYVVNNFLITGIKALENGTYSKSSELQSVFTKYKDELNVYLQLYVSNNEKNISIEDSINKFNIANPKYKAEIFYLDDIKELYYGQTDTNKKDLTVSISSINKGTILNFDKDNYKLNNLANGRYVLTPVSSVYELYKEAKKSEYPIFDENIREYLGNKGINKNIYETLMNPNERNNFFYYNNGVTVICDHIGSYENNGQNLHTNISFKIKNPQIVNGCQTVNSIYTALDNFKDMDAHEIFKDTFVMLKVLEIDKSDFDQSTLYQNIVKYNNSQNNIDEKTFVANNELFRRIQKEFEKKGFLVLIKQSDKNTYNDLYDKKKMTYANLKKLNEKRVERFGLSINKTSDLFIPIEKLLQVLTAFGTSSYFAYNKKSNMLKFGTEQYNNCVDLIKSNSLTIDAMLELYLLYLKLEKVKKEKQNIKVVPFYGIEAFSLFLCNNKDSSYILNNLNEKNKVDELIILLSTLTNQYCKEISKVEGYDYNTMIKKQVDIPILNECFDEATAFIQTTKMFTF